MSASAGRVEQPAQVERGSRHLLLAEIGVEADEVGVANAGSKVLSSTPKPPKTAGEKIADEGEGGSKIAEYLVAQKII